MKKISNEDNDKIKKALTSYYKVDTEYKAEEKIYKGKKEKIKEVILRYMDKYETDVLEVEKESNALTKENIKITCKKSCQTKINYDINALEEKFGKKDVSKILDKTYEITDFEGLVKLLKKAGVSPKEFKKYISVIKTVNEKKLDELSDLGMITIEDLEGCYDMQYGNPYLRVSVAKK